MGGGGHVARVGEGSWKHIECAAGKSFSANEKSMGRHTAQNVCFECDGVLLRAGAVDVDQDAVSAVVRTK